MTKSSARKPKSSPYRALSIFIAGILLCLTPNIIKSVGYGNRVLIANERVRPPFDKSLIMIFHHDLGGAYGIVVNKPLTEKQREQISPFLRDSGMPVYFGGPREVPDRVFVIKEIAPESGTGEPDYILKDWDEAIKAEPDLVEKVKQSVQRGQPRYLVVVGYASWNPFQLEDEILVRNMWFNTRVTHDVVFQKGQNAAWDALERKEKEKHRPKPDQS